MALQARRYRWLLGVAGLAALMAVAVPFLPLRGWAQERLAALLRDQGLQNVQLTLSEVGLSRLSVKTLSFGGEKPLTLENIALDYSLFDLMRGRARSLALGGLKLEARRVGTKWVLSGWESKDEKRGSQPLLLPATEAEVASFPLESATLDQSQIGIFFGLWKMEIPLKLAWAKAPLPKLVSTTKGLTLEGSGLKGASGAASAEAVFDSAQSAWKGPWEIHDINLQGMEPPLPVLEARGTLTAKPEEIVVEGKIESADKTTHMTFATTVSFVEPAKSALRIAEAGMPWYGGNVSLRNTLVPIGGAKPIHATLEIQRVSAEALMRQLTGDKASASGTLSGTLPLTITADGGIVFQEGDLKADDREGTLTLSPDVVPGDNPQVSFVREVLKNFHYTYFSVRLSSAKDNRLTVEMRLDGYNPDVAAGKAVKVNVHLTGDVLELVQKNLLWLTDPQKFLEQGDHANP
ncbi:MAG: hypothetical protein HGA90_02810 [Alphaproteobacteria bacterium]|nr:hypothetical protein [Alphaproteobacteria bacterium]